MIAADGAVLFDAHAGHLDRVVDDAVDDIDIEYLEVLITVAGNRYAGPVTVARSASPG